jgi:hypothetical protein
MGSTLSQLFRSCLSSSNQSCACKLLSSESLTSRPISQPIDMIIVRSVTPLPSFNLSIPVYLFLPSNLRGVVNFLRIQKTNSSVSKEFYDYLRHNIDRANGFICNSLKEFDEKYVDEFHQISGKQASIHFVGPLILNDSKSTESKVSID